MHLAANSGPNSGRQHLFPAQQRANAVPNSGFLTFRKVCRGKSDTWLSNVQSMSPTLALLLSGLYAIVKWQSASYRADAGPSFGWRSVNWNSRKRPPPSVQHLTDANSDTGPITIADFWMPRLGQYCAVLSPSAIRTWVGSHMWWECKKVILHGLLQEFGHVLLLVLGLNTWIYSLTLSLLKFLFNIHYDFYDFSHLVSNGRNISKTKVHVQK